MDVATTSCLSGVLRMVSVVTCGWMVVSMEGVWKGMDVMASMLHVAVTGINLVIKLVLCMTERKS
jgi:hypothetical protein